MRHVALTGATGYVGSIIADDTAPATRLVRRAAQDGDIAWTLGAPNAGLQDALASRGVTDLVHAAWDMTTSARASAERICVEGSLDLLRIAKAAGISRVIFISTISAFDEARSVYGQTKRQVEKAVLAEGGVVLRLGLVHGGGDGGMFGTIRRSVRSGRFVPMIGSGRGPQHLVDAERLQRAVRRAFDGDFDNICRPITLADETPIRFRDLVRQIATEEGRQPILVPVPWRVLYFCLFAVEGLGLTPPIRSDSVVSFVHANPAPNFETARELRL